MPQTGSRPGDSVSLGIGPTAGPRQRLQSALNVNDLSTLRTETLLLDTAAPQ